MTKRKHFIGLAGMAGGYLPNTCSVYESRREAAESLAALHERGKVWANHLARDGYAALRKSDGNDYAEIVECGCDNPESHND
jgi:hypothetical protein